MTQEFNSLEEIRINLPVEYKGLYLVRITDTDGKNYTRKMLVRYRE